MKPFWHGRVLADSASWRIPRRLLAGLLVVLALTAAACGSPKRATAPAKTPSATPTASPSESLPPVSPSALVGASPSVATSPSARPTPVRSLSPSRGPNLTPSPTKPSPAASPAVAPEPVAVPTPGAYTYSLSGSYQTPLAPSNQPYPAGSTLSTVFTTAGSQVTAKISSPQDNASTSTTWIYGPSGVVITDSTLTYLGLANYDCSYTPPPAALPNPLVAGTLPTASWSSANCSGDVSVHVVDREALSAAGKSWEVWRVQTTLHYQAQSSINVTVTSTVLFSAAAGVPIMSDTSTSGTVAGQPFSDHQVATLTSIP